MVSESVINSLLNSLVLALGFLLLLGQLIVVYKKNWAPERCVRWMGLTLIVVIVAYLAVISSTVNATALTAVIGLLGTIAGYLVGSELKQPDSRDQKPG